MKKNTIKSKQNLKPNSFWKVWYEGRPTIVQISICGEYFFAIGQEALWKLNNAEFIEEIPPFFKYYIAFDNEDVIWGTGETPQIAKKDALLSLPDFSKCKLKICQCTKEVYDDVQVNGYCHGDDGPYWSYDPITAMAYYPSKTLRESVFNNIKKSLA
jgi:hypothetical protein